MEPPFVILKSTSWLPVEETSTLLGAVVKNFWAPTDNSVPANPLQYNKGRKFVERGYDDFVLSNQDGAGKAAETKLQGITNITWRGVVDDEFDLHGKRIHYIKLRQVDQFWKDLKEDPEVKNQVPKWIGPWQLKSKPPVCLITGLFICEDVVLKSSEKGSQDREAKIEAPMGTAAAATGASQGLLLPSDGTGNLEAGYSVNKTQTRLFNATDKGGSIFAMQLKIISSEIFNKKALELKDKSPAAPSQRQMGEDEGLPSVESLILEDGYPESWEAWENQTPQN